MRATVIVTVLAALACSMARADVEDLEQFLHSVEAANHVSAPLRADGEMHVTVARGETRTAVVIIVRPPADTYIELQHPGFKGVLPSAGGPAYVLKPGGSAAQQFADDMSFADSDFTREDLEPFRVARYSGWRISDDTGGELTVTLFPKASQYSLVVMTFDREKKVPVKTLYYRETQNNLVKMRRDEGYALVGRKWMPTTISMESFKLRTRTNLAVQWTQNPSFPPELFDPAFLPRPSSIVWPSKAGTAAVSQ